MILLAGCAGRTASPVQIQRLNDQSLTSEAIQVEIDQIGQEISAKEKKQSEILGTNIILGITGFFVIVPWFFMNLKDAEGTEIEALKQRQQWLSSLAQDQEAGAVPAGQTQSTNQEGM
jgi:hypothetical protein